MHTGTAHVPKRICVPCKDSPTHPSSSSTKVPDRFLLGQTACYPAGKMQCSNAPAELAKLVISRSVFCEPIWIRDLSPDELMNCLKKATRDPD